MERVFPIVRETPASGTRKLDALVLVDADNINFSRASTILAAVRQTVNVVDFQAFGDFEHTAKDWANACQDFAEIKTQSVSAAKTMKNGADIALTISAVLSVLESSPDIVFLLSSDSDFTPLVKFIQARGITVFGVADSKIHAARKNLFDGFLPIEAEAKAVVPKEPKDVSPQDLAKQEPREINHAYQIIRNVLIAIGGRKGCANLRQIGSELSARYPDFNTRTYGYSQLSELVKAIDKFNVTGTGGNIQLSEKT